MISAGTFLKGEWKMKDAIAVASAVLVATFLGMPPPTFAEQGESDVALARALMEPKLPLEAGLAASSHEGTPISAKYELEDDDADELQLSVYTMRKGSTDVDIDTGDVTVKDATFAEVIVDYTTGKISKVVPIKDGEDLAAAKNQSKAMAQAKRSLEAATVDAVKAHSGYRAVSAIPDLRDGHPVVKVILVNGSEWKTVYETLD
jgi:hypothetical protein